MCFLSIVKHLSVKYLTSRVAHHPRSVKYLTVGIAKLDQDHAGVQHAGAAGGGTARGGAARGGAVRPEGVDRVADDVVRLSAARHVDPVVDVRQCAGIHGCSITDH
jgi:hypothetical protein